MGGVPDTKRAIACLRRAFSNRSIQIASGSVLYHMLSEAQKFVFATRDLNNSPTQAETDERIIRLAEPILIVHQLSDAISILARRRTPSLTQRLRQLAAFKKGRDEAENQFQETAYEIYCACEFARYQYPIAFIDPRQASRYKHRVEFLIKHKWPVECKRPRSERGILKGVRDTCDKIDERSSPGIVCVGLENALPGKYFFWELLDDESIRKEVRKRVQGFLDNSGEELMDIVSTSQAVGILLHYTAICYNHGDETVELPHLRTVLLRDRTNLACDVIRNLVTYLELFANIS